MEQQLLVPTCAASKRAGLERVLLRTALQLLSCSVPQMVVVQGFGRLIGPPAQHVAVNDLPEWTSGEGAKP
jgi:hypothetical protein